MTMLDLREFARAQFDALMAAARRWLAEGASGNYAAAALIGFAAFGFALLGQEGPGPSAANAARPTLERVAPAPSKARSFAAPLTEERPALLVAKREERTAPSAQDMLLTYEVDYFWPDEPQTVAASTRIRSRPEAGASVLTVATPGERLRINGRIRVGATDWYRVRLPEARDGYFAGEDVVALSDFRRRRAAAAHVEAAQNAAVTSPEAGGTDARSGAPLGASLSAPPPSDDILPLF